MTKGLKFGIIFLSLFLIGRRLSTGLKNKKKMIFDIILKKYGEKRANKFIQVYNALLPFKFSENQLKWLLSQIMQETGVFDDKLSSVFDDNTNASGISWSGSSGQISTGAKQGTLRPKSETGHYAKYATLKEWAKDYLRILNKGAMPLNATSIEDFVNRLAENNYFRNKDPRYPNDKANYLKNVKFYYKLINI